MPVDESKNKLILKFSKSSSFEFKMILLTL